MRKGEIPHPPQGMGEHPDEIYTQGGFFGDWVHLYRRHNPGIPKAWSDDSLMYAGADINAMTPTDLGDPAGEPLPFLAGDGVSVAISRRSAPMPFCERHADAHQIRFYHRGSVVLETELGRLDAQAGDFVVIGKGIAYRERPTSEDNAILVFETDEPIALAEAMWDSVGYTSMFVDYSGLATPEPDGKADPNTETRVRLRSGGRWHELIYDFDPCADVTGWVGDPVVYRLNVSDVPGIGTARGFLPPPAHAVLMSESKSFFFNVLGVPPLPTQPAPEGSFGAPAHLNDYDELWLNHTSELAPHTVGHLWLFPRTVPHPGAKRAPSYPPNPVRKLDEIKINFDTKAKLEWTPEAKEAFLPGDPRKTVFTSLYGAPADGD